jgi:hypothetical protein
MIENQNINVNVLNDPNYLSEIVPRPEQIELASYINCLYPLYELIFSFGTMHSAAELSSRKNRVIQSVNDGLLPKQALDVLKHIDNRII